ncbi:MAG: hypothetical protein IJL26_00665 [Clostridia bacterium]|nr:hypothetical protein [Clostridia bacterium]
MNAGKKLKNGRRDAVGAKKKDGATGLRIVPSVLAAVAAAALCFFAAALLAAALMYAFDAPFEKAYLGYLAAAGLSAAVSSAVFVRRCGLPPAAASPLWALAATAVHALALGVLAPQGAHRLPILLTAAVAALAFGFLSARVRKA